MGKEQTVTIADLEHIGIMVQDIQKAAHFYATTLGIGPFRVFEINRTDEAQQGETSTTKIKIGIAQKGQMIVELIEVTEGKSIFNEFADADGGGLLHLGFNVSGGDFEQEITRLEAQGIKVLYSGKTSDGNVAFLGGEGTGGVLIELMQFKKPLLERLTDLQKEQ